MSRLTNRVIVAAAALLLAGSTLVGCGVREPAPAAPGAEEPAPTAFGMTVEEYPIVEDSVDRPDHFEFRKRVDPQIFEKRKAVREARPGVDDMNRTLERFGYELRAQEQPGEAGAEEARYSLYKGEELILSGILGWSLSRVHVNASETDWFFTAYADRTGGVLVRSGKLMRWDEREHLHTRPVYLGDDLAWVVFAEDSKGYRLEREGETFFEGSMPGPAVDHPFKSFIAWNDHWAVKVDGDVIIDGESLREKAGYDKAFTLRLIQGRPFYFFEKDGKIHLWYDGAVADKTYDEVIHYRCCEPAAFNPAANDSMVWFWARRGERWHYVEAGIYDDIT